MIIMNRADRDQFHINTANRIQALTGKRCKCGERRIKSLLIQKDRTISCYNCKKHNKQYAYEISGNMQKGTRLHYDEVSALGALCWNEGCTERRVKALMVINHGNGKALICHNCKRFTKVLRYEHPNYGLILPW